MTTDVNYGNYDKRALTEPHLGRDWIAGKKTNIYCDRKSEKEVIFLFNITPTNLIVQLAYGQFQLGQNLCTPILYPESWLVLIKSY